MNQIQQIKELEDALVKMNIEYRSLIESKEYLLGRRIYIIKSFIKYRNIKGLFFEFIHVLHKGKNKQINTHFSNRWINNSYEENASDKVVVYTCLVGGYETLAEPIYVPPNTDFVAYTDFEIDKDSIWDRRDIREIYEASGLDSQRKNRYIKLHPHILFPEYEYSIYIDARILVVGNIRRYIGFLHSKIPIAVNWHSSRNCLYDEAKECIKQKRDDADTIVKQVERYKCEGFPSDFGLIEGGVLARKHNDVNCIKIMDTWWNEILYASKRDQLSFPFSLWKNGFSMNDISFLGFNIWKSDEITILPRKGLGVR